MAMKKLNYTLTVYKNTGFNGLDIPKTGDVLNNASHNTYNDVYYLREDIDLPQISVNDNYHNLADVDYVKLVSNDNSEPTTYYYFATPHASAGNTTVLSLELDALTTMGGAGNINYISGWQERGHIDSDEDILFENIAPEDWSPSQPLKSTNYAYVTGTGGVQSVVHPSADLQIIITNIDLVKLGNLSSTENIIDVIKGGVYNSGTGTIDEENMYIPRIETAEASTMFFLLGNSDPSGLSDVQGLSIPNTCAYDVTNPVVRKGLDILFSCGQLQLQGSYTIPKEYVIKSIAGVDFTTATEDGLYTRITGHLSFEEISSLPFEYTVSGYTVKNKKCYAMFRNVTLSNIASGSTVTKDVYNLKYGNATHPIVKMWSDAVSTGKPSAKMLSDTETNVTFVDVVNGTPWSNNQILMEGASGSVWNAINASFAQQSIDRDISQANINHNFAVENISISQGQLEIQQQRERLSNYIKGGLGVGAATVGIVGLTAATGGLALPAIAAAGGGAATAFGAANDISNTSNLQTMQQQALELQRKQERENYFYSTEAMRQRVNENNVGLLKSNSVVAPTAYFTPDPNLAMYGFNKFVIYETKLQDIDLKSLDNYFQRFGYNGIHRPLTQACFNCRQYYTFVQAFDVNIKSTASFGMRVRNKAISQLNGGVRVWSVLPDASYYETN